MTKLHHGLITYSNQQNGAAFMASQAEFEQLGITYDLVRINNHFTFSSILKILFSRAAIRDRVADISLISALLFGRYSFLIIKPASLFALRPLLTLLVLLIARARGLPTYTIWGNCLWNLKKIEALKGRLTVRAGRWMLSRPWIHHLAPTPECARDANLWSGIRAFHLINNCPDLPPEFGLPKPPSDPPLIVNAASVQPRKGPDIFVEVAAKVCRLNSDAQFVWIGGHADEELQRQIRSYGLMDKVHFIGRVFPPYPWMEKASAIFFSSRSEAFGLTVAEAMACYRTVLCFEDTGPSFIVGDTGHVAKRFDTESVAREICSLIALPARQRINFAARDRYDNLFAPPRFARVLYDVIMSEARGTKGGRLVFPEAASYGRATSVKG